MANDNTLDQAIPDVFVREVMRYLDGMSSPEEFEHLKGQLNGSEDHRRVFVQMSLQAQAMAEGLAARELVGSALTDESSGEMTQDDGPSDVLLEVVEQALRARALHDIEDRANKQLAEDNRLQKIEAERARARAKMFPADRGPRLIVIPKAVAYLGSGLVAALLVLLVYLVVTPSPQASDPGETAGVDDPAPGSGQPQASRYVAELIKVSDDAAWADRSAGWVAGMPLEAGEINLAQGAIVIRLNDGAEVTLRAPVRFSVLNANHSELHHGQLSASVPESAHGFEVLIPGGVVTDLGTEFSLKVAGPDEAQPSHVEVIDGLVTVAPRRAGQRGEATALRRAQFAQVPTDGREIKAFEHTNELVAIEVPNTGQRLSHAQTDHNWQVRRDDDQRSYPAIVLAPKDWTRPEFLHLDWAHGDPNTSQWLSFSTDGFQGEDGSSSFFYSTRFHIPENFDPDTVELNLKIMMDNQVMAIRVNGELVAGRLDLPFPDDDRSDASQYHTWVEQTLADCFVPGDNTIEFELLNDGVGATGLRVEMDSVGTQTYAPLGSP